MYDEEAEGGYCRNRIYLFILCAVLIASCNSNSKPHTTSTDIKVDVTIKVFSNNNSLSSSRYGKKGVEIFKENNPGVEAVFEFTDSKEYEQKLKLKLMASDNDFDVFIADNNIVPELVKNQAFYDLSSFDSILKTLNSMSYGIKQLCLTGETIVSKN